MASSRFKLQGRIAQGGMGEIHLAHDTLFERTVVIKYLLDVAAADTERVEMFLHEGRAIARCEHPNVVRILDVGQESGRYFMALEHLDGWDTASVLKRAVSLGVGVPVSIVLRLIVDAALGLHAAHEARGPDGEQLALVHRDVSLHNLFVTRSGLLKVLDFGVAKTGMQRHATDVGTLKGTLAYMSPEQCRGEALDRRSDVFSLGVVMHELLSGERLFRRETQTETFAAILNGHIPPPRGNVSEGLVGILNRSLQRNRELRFSTALAFAEALQSQTLATREEVAAYLADALGDLTVVNAATRLQQKTSPTVQLEQWRRPKRVMAIAAMIAVVAVLVWTLLRRDEAVAPSVGATIPVAPSPPVAIAPSPPVAVAPSPPVAVAPSPPVAIAPSPPVAIAPSPPVAVAPSPPVAVAPSPPVAIAPNPLVAVPGLVVHVAPTPAPQAPARRVKHREPLAAAAPGLLTIQSSPWANVYINGALVGSTPIVEHALPAGVARVRLLNPDSNLEQNETVAIIAGQALRLRFNLRDKRAHVID